MKLILLNIFFFVSMVCGLSQENSVISIKIKSELYNKIILANDSNKITNGSNKIVLSDLKFYLSNFKLYNNKTLVWEEGNSFYLYDINKESSNEIKLFVPDKLNYNKIVFNLGIDSITNVSGAYGGDLDPTKGMYWTWQSGYINFKCEGKKENESGAVSKFMFHLGGYSLQNNALQKLEFNLPNQKQTELIFSLDKFIESELLATTNKIMLPSPMSVQLSKLAASCFKLK